MSIESDTHATVEVNPMEIDDRKSDAPPKAKCFDLPDQNSKSLSMFLLVGLCLTLMGCAVWMWYFKDNGVIPELGVTTQMVNERVIFVAVVSTIVTLAGLYGVKSLDRGWLIVTIIGQISLINTITYGVFTEDSNSDAQLRGIVAFVHVSSILTSWVAWRLSEKIQEEQLNKLLILGKGSFMAGFDLPDMTNVGMELWLIGTSIGLSIFGLIFIIMGALSDPDIMWAYYYIFHYITLGLVNITAGATFLVFFKLGYGRTRIILTITMMLAMFAMIMISATTGWLSMNRSFFAYECEELNDEIELYPDYFGPAIDDCQGKAKLTYVQISLQYLSGILAALHIWLAWRLSERVQTQALHDSAEETPTSVSTFLKPYKLLGIQVTNPYNYYVQSLLLACFFTVAATGGFFCTWFIVSRVDKSNFTADEEINYQALSDNILDNYINVIVNIVAVCFTLFGVYDNDRGILLMATMLFFIATGWNYDVFMVEYTTVAKPDWYYGGEKLPETWIKDVGRISSGSRLITMISSWFGAFNTYIIAEIFQEKQQMTVAVEPGKE